MLGRHLGRRELDGLFQHTNDLDAPAVNAQRHACVARDGRSTTDICPRPLIEPAVPFAAGDEALTAARFADADME